MEVKTLICIWQPHGNHAARFRDLYLPPFVGPRSVLALRRIVGRIWAAPSAFDVRIQLEAHRSLGYNHESMYFSARKVRATRAILLSPPQISKEIRLSGPWTRNRVARCGWRAGFMSALPPIADIQGEVVECPLLTQSGHWGPHRYPC